MARAQTPADLEAEARWLDDWHERLPPFLYKYTGLAGERRDWFRALVNDSVLCFSEFRRLNDPFDGLVVHDFTADEEAIREYWTAHWKDQPSAGRDLVAGMKNAVRLAGDREGQQHLGRGLLEHNSKNGVWCATSKPDDLLMWAYYADGHTGLCLRFRTSEIVDNMLAHGGPTLVPVTYSEEVPVVNFYTSTTRALVQAQIGTKAQHWRHEDEWRLVLTQRSGLVSFPPEALDGIIMGSGIKPEDEEFVRALVKDRSPAIQLLRASKKDGEYALQIGPA